MKICLLNTPHGLIPMYDDDYDEKKKLKFGQVYTCEVRQARNYQFHKKYFSLINCAWEHLPEKTRAYFSENKTSFRKTVEVAAGWYEMIYSIQRKEWIQAPKSIAFDKMDNVEFETLYENVKTVLFNTFLRHISAEEFFNHLLSY